MQSLDESVEFAVGKGSIDIAVALRQFTADIFAAHQHFERVRVLSAVTGEPSVHRREPARRRLPIVTRARFHGWRSACRWPEPGSLPTPVAASS